MSCRNPEISDQIVAWVDGALSPEDTRVFTSHIDQCEDCKRDVEVLRGVTRDVQSAFGTWRNHPDPAACPSPDDLVDFAAGTAPPNRAAMIETHLEICVSCREHIEIMRELDGAPSETERDSAPALPASLRAAFRTSFAVTGGGRHDVAAGVPIPSALPSHRPSGWGIRRVLAAAASVMVIVGISALLITRPDIIVSTTPPPALTPSVAESLPKTSLQNGAGEVRTPSTAAPAPVAASPALVAAAPTSRARVPESTAVAKSAGMPGAAGGSAAPPPDGVASTGSGLPAPAAASHAPGGPPARLPAAKPVPAVTIAVTDKTPPTVSESSTGRQEKPVAPAVRPEKDTGTVADTRPVTAPRPVVAATAPRPVTVPRTAPNDGFASPPHRVAVTASKVSAEKDKRADEPVVSKAGPRESGRKEGPSVEVVAKKGVPPTQVAGAVTSNAAVLSPRDTGARRRDNERTYTQSADDLERNPVAAKQGGDTPAPPPAAPDPALATHSAQNAQAVRPASNVAVEPQTSGQKTAATRAASAAQPASGASAGIPAGAPAAQQQRAVVAAEGKAHPNAAARPARPATTEASDVAQSGMVMRGGAPSSSQVQAQVAARARQAVSGLVRSQHLEVSQHYDVRVTIEPADAQSISQARRIRVEVVLPGASADVSNAVRRELIRSVPLNTGRGDEVIIYTP